MEIFSLNHAAILSKWNQIDSKTRQKDDGGNLGQDQ